MFFFTRSAEWSSDRLAASHCLTRLRNILERLRHSCCLHPSTMVALHRYTRTPLHPRAQSILAALHVYTLTPLGPRLALISFDAAHAYIQMYHDSLPLLRLQTPFQDWGTVHPYTLTPLHLYTLGPNRTLHPYTFTLPHTLTPLGPTAPLQPCTLTPIHPWAQSTA